jgi:hypothetical protein
MVVDNPDQKGRIVLGSHGRKMRIVVILFVSIALLDFTTLYCVVEGALH